MREQIGSTGVSDETLAAYFDGELDDAEADRVRAALDGESESELRAELDGLELVGGLVRESLARKANQVPQARFEQIWDQVDRAIAAQDRLRESTEASASIWTRLWAAFRPLRWPVAAAAAAAAVTVLVVGQGQSDPNELDSPPNKGEQVAVEQPSDDAATPPETPETMPTDNPASDSMLAERPAAPEAEDLPPMPVPESADVEIHGVEFGGKGGRISNSGTVTVLYVEEEAEPADSERSL